ncbi:MAG: hypothetical protein HGA45_01160 [Chloroflexales bacterium]|nr:hypothetical protein [Chloroflexales bacterium]
MRNTSRARWIAMSPETSARLGYGSKLHRDTAFLAGLLADGEAQGNASQKASEQQRPTPWPR